MSSRLGHMDKNLTPQEDRPPSTGTNVGPSWQEPDSRGIQYPTTGPNHISKPLISQNGNEHLGRTLQSVPSYGDAAAANGNEFRREGPAQTSGDGRSNVPANLRHAEYPHSGRRHSVMDIRVYSIPYAFTANREPLFIQYGTLHGDMAASAVYSIGNGYAYSPHYPSESYDQFGGPGYGQSQMYTHHHPSYTGQEAYRHTARHSDHAAPPAEAGHYTTTRSRVDPRAAADWVPSPESRGTEHRAVLKERLPTDETKLGHGRAAERGTPGSEPRGVMETGGTSNRSFDYEKTIRVDFCGQEEHGSRPGSTSKPARPFPFRTNQKGPSGRITWTDDLHEQFLGAVDEIGLDNAVPMSILNKMDINGLTREQVASHLQKHRTTLKKMKEDKERELLLTLAAKSVIEKDSTLAKRNLTAEEVLVAVEEEAKSSRQVMPDLSDLSPADASKKSSLRGPLKKIVGKKNRQPSGERDVDMSHKAKKRRYMTKV